MTHRSALDLYALDAGKRSEPVTREEEAELARRKAAGDSAARDRLIEVNLRYAMSIAREYQGYGLTMEELMSAAHTGMCQAADRFDGQRGYKFISYAVWWIRQAIRAALSAESRLVRIPVSTIKEISVMRQARADIECQVGRDATAEELRAAGIDRPEELLLLERAPCSLDAPVQTASDLDMMSLVADETDGVDERIDAEQMQGVVRQLIASLEDKRQVYILTEYYGLAGDPPRTMQSIARSLCLTRQRVEQIHARAMKALRQLDLSAALEMVRDSDS